MRAALWFICLWLLVRFWIVHGAVYAVVQDCGVAGAVGGGGWCGRGVGQQGEALADHRHSTGGKLYYNVEEIGYATCLMKCCNIEACPGFLVFETA